MNKKFDLSGLSEASAEIFQKESSPIAQKLNHEIGKARLLMKNYALLENKGLVQILYDTRSNSKNENISVSAVVTANRTNSIFSEWLQQLQTWSLAGYQNITTTRELITGQKLIYQIQERTQDKNILYTLNEEQYLEWLKSVPISGSRTSWDDIQKAADGKSTLMEAFNLNVDYSSTLFKERAQKLANVKDVSKIKKVADMGPGRRTGMEFWEDAQGISNRRDLNKDVLYNYIFEKAKAHASFYKIVKGEKVFQNNRVLELYSQLRNSIKWSEEDVEKGFEIINAQNTELGEKRREEINQYMQKYINAKLNVENDKFYEAGDAIQSATVLIENKVKGAIISISTIKNGVEAISLLGQTEKTKKDLQQKFQELFTATPELAEGLHQAAYETAVENIQKEFENLQLLKT